MSAFFNVSSLLIGLVAWALPLSTIFTMRYRAAYPTVSFGLCSLALLLQLMEAQNRVRLHDWSALEDTWYAVVFAGIVLLLVNLVLNIVAYVIAKLRR